MLLLQLMHLVVTAMDSFLIFTCEVDCPYVLGNTVGWQAGFLNCSHRTCVFSHCARSKASGEIGSWVTDSVVCITLFADLSTLLCDPIDLLRAA